MKSITTKFGKTLIALPVLLVLVSCGSNKPSVKDIKVEPRYEGADLYLSVSADLSIGNLSLQNISLPIIVPRSGENIGSISMVSQMDGANLLDIDLNVSAVANVQGQEAKLPNGNPLPLIGSSQTIVIPVSKGAEIYLTLNNGQVAIGTAIPIKTLDQVGHNVGTASLFPSFHIDKAMGSAGIFTSKTAGQNGIGLFVDVSAYLEKVMFMDLGFDPSIMAMQDLEYGEIEPSRRKERRLNRELYYLDRRRAQLQM